MVEINPIFENESYFKTASAVLGFIKNYKQDTSIEQLENEIKNIKSILELDNIKLNDIELSIVNLFINKSVEKYQAIDRISIEDTFFNSSLKYDTDDILKSLEILESYNFIERNSYFNPKIYYLYNLKYDIFFKSNLIEEIFKKSLTYIDITNMVLNYLIKNYKNNEGVKMETILNDLTLDTLLLNPILYRLNKYKAIKFSKIMPSNDLVVHYLFVNRPKLLSFKKIIKNKL